MARKTTKKIPVTGEAFAFPLGDGRYSVCRVVLDARSPEAKQWQADVSFVVGSVWIGDRIPAADDLALRPILHATHHNWRNEPSTLWVPGAPPSDFVPIGRIEPTPADLAMNRMAYGGWNHFAIHAITQWRWDHDREALLAEDAGRAQEHREQYRAQQRQRAEHLSRVTLAVLQKHRFFASWSIPAAKAIRASRQLMTDTVTQLVELGPNASETDRVAVLRRCIERFNELDSEMRFIETDEREDICEEFEAIVHACGLGAHENLADEWRDW
jgi:hypothetical protein